MSRVVLCAMCGLCGIAIGVVIGLNLVYTQEPPEPAPALPPEDDEMATLPWIDPYHPWRPPQPRHMR